MKYTEEDLKAKMEELSVTGFSSRAPFSIDERMDHLFQIEKILKRRAGASEEYFQDEPKIPETKDELEQGFIELRAALSYVAFLADGLVQHFPPTLPECQEIKDEAMKVLERYDL